MCRWWLPIPTHQAEPVEIFSPSGGAITRTGSFDTRARSFGIGFSKNVDILPKDICEVTELFVKRRQGDVLLNWETEAIIAKRRGGVDHSL